MWKEKVFDILVKVVWEMALDQMSFKHKLPSKVYSKHSHFWQNDFRINAVRRRALCANVVAAMPSPLSVSPLSSAQIFHCPNLQSLAVASTSYQCFSMREGGEGEGKRW